MNEKKYNANQNYCDAATKFQSVPSYNEYGLQHPDVDPKDYDSNRACTPYSCPDNYQMGAIQDNQIYIATTDPQHDQIREGKHVDAHGGLSGYFSDQATVDASKTGDALDNTKYNEMCQIAPFRPEGISGEGNATYKPHVDCFEINRDTLYKNYRTYDFNAAISKCEANNHFGAGGGNQGYNPYLSEMIDNGTLKHVPEKSYSDPSISECKQNNPNLLMNSVVPEDRAEKMYADAQTRAQDCVKNNTPHPSYEARNNGYPPNTNPIESNTGHATPVRQTQSETCGASTAELPPIQPMSASADVTTGPDNLAAISRNAGEASKAASNAAESGQSAANSFTGGMV